MGNACICIIKQRLFSFANIQAFIAWKPLNTESVLLQNNQQVFNFAECLKTKQCLMFTFD